MTRRQKILGLANELEGELTEAVNNEEWYNDAEKGSMLDALTALVGLDDDIRDVFFQKHKEEQKSGESMKSQNIPMNEFNKESLKS